MNIWQPMGSSDYLFGRDPGHQLAAGGLVLVVQGVAGVEVLEDRDPGGAGALIRLRSPPRSP
jgi:hypothetical protein